MGKWVKSNWLIVVCAAIPLIAIPLGWFFSSKWNSKIRATMQEDVTTTTNKINNIQATYLVPPLIPGQAPFEVRMTPNQSATVAVADLRRANNAQADRLRELAEQRNSEGRTLLVDDEPGLGRLFPEPKDASSRLRLSELFVQRWKAAHRALFEDNRLGSPDDPAALLAQVRQAFQQEVENLKRGRQNPVLTPEEVAGIRERMTALRLNRYLARGAELVFYADEEVFPLVANAVTQNENGSFVAPSVETLWEWQEAYWLHSDVIDALVKANSARGSALSAPQAPVKRLLTVAVEPVGGSSRGGDDDRRRNRGGEEEDSEGGGEDTSAPAGDGSTPIDPNYSVSHTGRAGLPVQNNGLYDVRYIDVELIADANRINEIVDAIGSTNFMSVIDLDQSWYDPSVDLAEGFAYGGDFLVLVTMRIEAVQFRAWRAGRMPAAVRRELGIPDPPSADPAAAAQDADGDGVPDGPQDLDGDGVPDEAAPE